MTKPTEIASDRGRRARPPARASVKPEGQWRHGDLRASLIAWGTHLIDTKGLAGMSMREAARLAGVSQGAPLHHFGNRDGLLAAIAAQGFRDMVALRQRRLDAVAGDDQAGRLRAVMLVYIEFALKHPARFALMYGQQIPRRKRFPELLEAGLASFTLLRSVVAPFLPQADRDGLSDDELAFAIWATTHGVATLAQNGMTIPGGDGRRPDVDHLAGVAVTFCLAALRSSRWSLAEASGR